MRPQTQDGAIQEALLSRRTLGSVLMARSMDFLRVLWGFRRGCCWESILFGDDRGSALSALACRIQNPMFDLTKLANRIPLRVIPEMEDLFRNALHGSLLRLSCAGQQSHEALRSTRVYGEFS